MRRVLALVLCICILFSLTACSGKKEKEVGMVSLLSEMLSVSNPKSSIDLSLVVKDVDKTSLFLSGLIYLGEKGTLSGFDSTVDSDGLLNSMLTSSINIKGDIIYSSNKDMFGEVDLSLNNSESVKSTLGLLGSSLFVDTASLKCFYTNYLKDSSSISQDDLSRAFESVDEGIVKINLDSFNTFTLKDYSSKLVSITPYLDKFVFDYCSSFVKSENEGYKITLNTNDIKSNIDSIYNIAKEHPDDFFDCTSELLVAMKSANLIDGTESNLVKELLGIVGDKKARKEYIKRFDSVSFDTFYSDVISEEYQSILTFLSDTDFEMFLSKAGTDYKYSLSLDCPAMTLKINDVISSSDDVFSLSVFDGAITYSSFITKLDKTLNVDDFSLNIVDSVDEDKSIDKPVDIYENEKVADSDDIINIVPLASISGLASILDNYNIIDRGMEESEFKDYVYSDFVSIAQKVGFNVDKIIESNVNHAYEISVKSDDATLLMKISADVGKLSYSITVPYVNPMITLQGWSNDVKTITGLSLGNSYLVEILKMAEDGVVSSDCLSYNMNSINNSLEYLITYNESDSNATLTFNIYTYLF